MWMVIKYFQIFTYNFVEFRNLYRNQLQNFLFEKQDENNFLL
jgi:hypothetical protein